MAARSTLAVILHADVVDSTALVQNDERIAHQRIRCAFGHLSATINEYGGKAHEIRGDALVAEFERASDAVSAALTFQLANKKRNQELTDVIRPALRIGVALGEVVIADGTVTGEGVVLAQRLEQLAQPNGLCISAAIREALPARLHFRYSFLGEQSIKGFDEPVRAFVAEAQGSDSIPAPETGPSSFAAYPDRKIKRLRLLVSVLGLFALLAGAGYLLSLGPWAPATRPWKAVASHEDVAKTELRPTLIVLPFANFSDDPEQEYFADGFTEDVTTALARIPGFLVTARNTAFTYKGKNVSASVLGQELRVRYILEGSVRKHSDRVRINAQLIETATGNHVWAETFDRPLADIFAIQDELVDHIVGTVASHLRRRESERALSAPPEKLAAYDLSIKARYLFKRDELSAVSEARALLRKAIEIDSSYALAYALLGEVENYFFTHRVTNEYASDDTSKRMVEATSRAIALAPDNAYAHAVHGIALRTLKQYKTAGGEAERAYALAPNDPDVLFAVSAVKLGVGDYEGTVETVRRAWALDPYINPLAIGAILAQALYALGEFEESKDAALFCLQRVPSDARCQESLVRALGELGPADEAQAAVEELLRLSPGYTVSEYMRRAKKNRNDPDAIERWANGLRKAGVPE